MYEHFKLQLAIPNGKYNPSQPLVRRWIQKPDSIKLNDDYIHSLRRTLDAMRPSEVENNFVFTCVVYIVFTT